MSPILRVAVPVPLSQTFDYRAPDGFMPAPGCRVLVPFGRRRVVGVVLEQSANSNLPAAQLKPVLATLDREPLISAELLNTLCWASRYYQHPIGEVLEAALPSALRSVRPLPVGGRPALDLTVAGRRYFADPSRRRGTRIDALLQALADGPLALDALDAVGSGWRAAARSLRTRGFIKACRLPPESSAAIGQPGPPLNAEQHAAVAAVAASGWRFAPFLLEGVTGSGKTEVYLDIIRDCLAHGRQALVLVPEIALTPQALRRFRERLGVDIAALHSGLGEGERARAWLAAARGEAQVVLGTRSAVFVPLPRAGLIVIDEEHDASYKQQEGFRYQARDLAVLRAKALDVPVVLGSATPALESLANVETGRYAHLGLRERAGGARPPALRVVDLRRERLEHGLAAGTLAAIGACLARGEQALVFKNRRGYAPVLMCRDCGWSAQCARCDRPLTLHRGDGRLRCHHCGAEERVPASCSVCGGLALAPQGQGTERLEDALKMHFPQTPVTRVDRDTTRGRAARDALLDNLAGDSAGILVGTQMLAKGHDLPNLTLVVVVGVDEGLYSVDFRAAERLGQLVVQVAGRAGRAEKSGEVWLQTHHPDHPLLHALLTGGYRALANALLIERRAAGLPPYAHFALLRAEAGQASVLDAFLADAARTAGRPAAVRVQGPMPAPIPRRAGALRGQLLIEADERAPLHVFLDAWLDRIRNLPQARRVRWSIDVDPGDLY